MTKELLISSSPHETKVAVLEDDQLVEVYFQRDTDVGLVGGIYKGRVNRVLPGMQSAFVDIGLERDAFLYVSDFFEDSDEYDRVFTEAESRADKLSEAEALLQGGTVAQAQAEAESRSDVSATPEPQAAAQEPIPSQATDSTALLQEGVASAESGRTSQASLGGPPSPERGFAPGKSQEFPARRSRRRGRRFRDFKYSKREAGRPAEEKREPSPEHGIELLPGESLAKYSRTAEERPSRFETSTSEAASEPEFEAPSTGATAPPMMNEASEPQPRREPPGTSVQNDSQDREEISTSSTTECSTPADTALTPPPSDDVEMGSERFPEPEHPSTARNPEDLPEQDETKHYEEDESNTDLNESLDRFAEPSGRTHTESDLFSDEETGTAASEPLPADVPSLLATPENEEPGPQMPSKAPSQQSSEREFTPEGSDMTARQSYTLRAPSHRARVAPRHSRRGRGRFRSHQGNRRDTGFRRGPEAGRAGNHQAVAITELLKEGQEILVQIAKEPLGAKGARITSHIALPGRYLVYMPTITHIGVSRKIGSEEERLRLRNIILESRGSLAGGFIVRTAAAGRSEDEIKADVTFLTHLWNDIRNKADRMRAPALLHRDLTLVERILRDLLSPEFRCLRVDNEIEYEQILEFINRFQPSLVGHVKLYTRDTPLFEEFGVQAEIDKALKPKVWLKSGGYIVINQTEALVAIDVNTGKYVGRTNRLEDTIVKTNIDAVNEIVRQIRMRDLGGIIVIDFIDMDDRRNRAKVVQALDDALRHDRAPTKILSFNEFGLVALTRKRVKHSLERTLCEPCPYCAGSGWVKSVATVSYDIVSESRKMASQIEGNTVHLRVNPEVAARLKARDGVLISEIESATHKDVVIKADPGVHQERFEIY